MRAIPATAPMTTPAMAPPEKVEGGGGVGGGAGVEGSGGVGVDEAGVDMLGVGLSKAASGWSTWALSRAMSTWCWNLAAGAWGLLVGVVGERGGGGGSVVCLR